MNNLYTIYTQDEINIFQKLATSQETLTATSKLIKISQKISLFKDIPETILIKILKDIKIIKYKKGEIIIQEGDNDDTISYILLGEVNIIKQTKIIATISNGRIIGEMAGLLKEKRTASIISNNNATTLISFKIDFNLMKTDLGYYFALIYQNLSVELAKKLLHQDNKIIKK